MSDVKNTQSGRTPLRWAPAPHISAPESSRNIFVVIAIVAGAPLAAGTVFFGYRCLWIAALSIGSCVLLENLYFRINHTPALAHRSHAWLTGMILALTLPPFVPWYVPVMAGAFAIIVGKAIFGGVGHYLWQPALVGRLAVAAMFAGGLNPSVWPVLAPGHVILGDCRSTVATLQSDPAEGPIWQGETDRIRQPFGTFQAETLIEPQRYLGWREFQPPGGVEGLLMPRPAELLRGLADRDEPRYASLDEAMIELPPLRDAVYGATPGGIGETCSLVILMAGLYLIYRHYVSAVLPLAVLAGAALTVALTPIYLRAGPGAPQALWPAIGAGGDPMAGITYVVYHLVTGELLLTAFFIAPEMTSRPVTPRGQLLFGLGCGVLGMILRLYVMFPLSCYSAVLVMNVLTPVLERLTRPRVLGRPPWWKFWVRRPAGL